MQQSAPATPNSAALLELLRWEPLPQRCLPDHGMSTSLCGLQKDGVESHVAQLARPFSYRKSKEDGSSSSLLHSFNLLATVLKSNSDENALSYRYCFGSANEW